MIDSRAHKYLFADQLRALAVISVMISHYGGIFWFDASLTSYINAIPEKLNVDVPIFLDMLVHVDYLIPNFVWSPFGVDIFFLISGFVIPMALERSSRTSFMVNRFFRLYPTYFIGFGFTILMLSMSSYYFNNTFPHSVLNILLHSIIGLRDIASTPHIDMIIWTLELELKFYILAIIFLPLFKKTSWLLFLIPTGIFLMIISISFLYQWETAYPLPLVIYMFIGTVFYFMLKKNISWLKTWVLISLLYSMYVYSFYRLSVSIIGYEYVKVISINGLYALMIFALSYRYRERFTHNRLLAFIASISYPFYIIHGIGGYIMMMILIKMGVHALLSVSITIAIMTAIAYLIHKYIEIPAIKFGKKI